MIWESYDLRFRPGSLASASPTCFLDTASGASAAVTARETPAQRLTGTGGKGSSCRCGMPQHSFFEQPRATPRAQLPQLQQEIRFKAPGAGYTAGASNPLPPQSAIAWSVSNDRRQNPHRTQTPHQPAPADRIRE